MFIHQGALPHPLTPESYRSSDFLEREKARLFHPAWHCLATTSELSRPGDFLTLDFCGVPIQIRNVEGKWAAYSNVCAHRHCLISGLIRGRSEKLRCQYHGWEYDADGKTGHIPEPKNFAPFEDGRPRIPVYRTETCGNLIFVTLNDDAPPLREYYQENFVMLENAFGDAWRLTSSWETEVPANWKIPLENSVEGYHIPAVHPETFKVAPTSERTTHVLGEGFTMYRTPNVAPSRFEACLFAVEKQVMRVLRREPTHSYSQYHLFPNLLVSTSDMLSLCVTALPVGVNRTQLRIRLFTYRGKTPSWFGTVASGAWSQLNRLFTKMVLKEDFAIYSAIQQGLEASSQRGRLGAIEERVFAFQEYVRNACDASAEAVESVRP